MVTQYCARCRQDLPLDAFHPGKRGQAGTYCRTCSRDYKRQRYGHGPRTAKTCNQPGCTSATSSPNAKYCADHRPQPMPWHSTEYRAVHHRISRARGRASEHACPCGAQAEQWAYNHTGIDEVTGYWNGKHVSYSTDATQYDPLCRSCHVKRDGNGYDGGTLQRINDARRANRIDTRGRRPPADRR